jgi:hypothetical protein
MCKTAGTRRTRRKRQFLAEYKKCRRDLEEDVKYKQEMPCIEERALNKIFKGNQRNRTEKLKNNPEECMWLETPMSQLMALLNLSV